MCNQINLILRHHHLFFKFCINYDQLPSDHNYFYCHCFVLSSTGIVPYALALYFQYFLILIIHVYIYICFYFLILYLLSKDRMIPYFILLTSDIHIQKHCISIHGLVIYSNFNFYDCYFSICIMFIWKMLFFYSFFSLNYLILFMSICFYFIIELIIITI